LLGKLGVDRRLGRRLVSPRGGGMAAVPHRRHHTPAGADRPFGDRRSRGRRWRHHHSLRWALADARQRRRHHAARRGPCGHDDLCRGRRGRRALDRRLAGEADRSRHELRDPRRVRTRERGLVRRLRGHPRGGLAPRKRARRSVAIDLKREPGRKLFSLLVRSADVVVENLRPGTMNDLGLAPRDLLNSDPRLVYVAVTGWGLDGPNADRPALDIIVQAQSGLMSVTGEEGGPPVKVGVSIADLAAALYATIATLGALRARDRDGKGQLVDISMLESAVSLAVWEAGVHFTTGEVPRAAGSAHKLVAPYQAIAAADRHFIVGATTPPTWTAFCRVLGLEGLERDPRYADATLRRHNRDSLIAAIEAITATKPAAQWLAALRAAGVPCGEIADYGDVFSDPH